MRVSSAPTARSISALQNFFAALSWAPPDRTNIAALGNRSRRRARKCPPAPAVVCSLRVQVRSLLPTHCSKAPLPLSIPLRHYARLAALHGQERLLSRGRVQARGEERRHPPRRRHLRPQADPTAQGGAQAEQRLSNRNASASRGTRTRGTSRRSTRAARPSCGIRSPPPSSSTPSGRMPPPSPSRRHRWMWRRRS